MQHTLRPRACVRLLAGARAGWGDHPAEEDRLRARYAYTTPRIFGRQSLVVDPVPGAPSKWIQPFLRRYTAPFSRPQSPIPITCAD